jgi:hypothetical protein
MAPSEWKMKIEYVPLRKPEDWSIEKLKAEKLLVQDGLLKEPSEICGVVQFPVWDFVEVNYYIYPVLHGEIRLVNDAFDGFYDYVDDTVEVMSDEEKLTWNLLVWADVTLNATAKKRNDWGKNEAIVISFYEVFKSEAVDALWQRGILHEEKNQLQHDKKDIEERILHLKNVRKGPLMKTLRLKEQLSQCKEVLQGTMSKEK